MTPPRRSSLVAALALVVLTSSLLASSVHAHPLGSADSETECGMCKWARVVGVATPTPGIQLQIVLLETSLMLPLLGTPLCAPSDEAAASRAPPRT